MTIKITEAQYLDMCENNGGYCLECYGETYGVEPDARNYKCEECLRYAVFGMEELLAMGAMAFSEDDE